MSRTHRKSPSSREAQRRRLEREWEQEVERQGIIATPPEDDSDVSISLPPELEALRQQAEAIVNDRTGTISPTLTEERASKSLPYSVQSPSTDEPAESGGGLVWWTGGSLSSYIPLHDYGNPQRIRDIRTFALISPWILNAESVLTKKVQALQWTIEGGRNLAQKWQRRLNNFENGDGWDFFVARWIRAYCESDRFACAELIRNAPRWAVRDEGGTAVLTPRGEAAIRDGKDKTWEIVDARVMDPVNVHPTTSKEFPLVYQNPWTGARHQMRTYQFMSLIDLPSVDDRYPGHGVCGVSRAVWAAQEARMLTRYRMERVSENPGAGLAIVNTSVSALQTALKDATAQREARGVVYYKGVIFLPVRDPTGSTKLEFLSFANLPDNFDHTEFYNMIKEVVATSFGLDILELGSIPGRLGTATQAKVAAAKGRTKSIGAIMQGIERTFRYKLLPESVTFSIKKHDQDEEQQRAEIDATYFENAIRFAQFAIDPRLPTQYLADRGAIPNEFPYVVTDWTAREEIADVQTPTPEETTEEGQTPASGSEAVETGPEGAAEADIVKRWKREGPRVRIDRDGKMTYLEMPYLAKRATRLYPAFSPPSIDRAVANFNLRHPALAGRLDG